MKEILMNFESNEFSMVYEIMRQAFPIAEIRTYEKAYSLLNNEGYKISVIRDYKNRIGGFIAVWDFDKFLFIEHFAVSKRIRGAGIGSEMMKEYLNQNKKPVIIEVEGQETRDAKRRVEFYRRLGFTLSKFGYMQPTLQSTSQELYLKIMSYPSGITEDEFYNFKKIVFSQVYKTTKLLLPYSTEK